MIPLHTLIPIALALLVLYIVLKSAEIERHKMRRRVALNWEIRRIRQNSHWR